MLIQQTRRNQQINQRITRISPIVQVRGVCRVLTCTFRALRKRNCHSVATRRFSGATSLLTRVLSQNIDLRLGHNLNQRCISHGSVLSSPENGVRLSRSLGAHSVLHERLIYDCSRFDASAHVGHVLGTAVVLLVHSSVSGTRGGTLEQLLPCFISIRSIGLSNRS